MNLVVYLSYKCDLKCPFCYVKNFGDEAVISKKKLFSATDRFLAFRGKKAGFTVLGGEPLLHMNLLTGLIERVRKKSAAPIHLFTNGLGLKSRFVDYCAEMDVKIIVSMSEISFLNASPALRKAAGRGHAAMYVLSAENADKLAGRIKEMRGFGFESLGWTPDITERWSAESLKILKRELLKVKKHYLELLKGGEIYEIANMYELFPAPGGKRRRGCPNIVLRPDGLFMPCDKAISAPRDAVGKYLFSGFKSSARKKFFDSARKDGVRAGDILCPVGVWAYFKYSRGASGQELKRAIESYRKVSRVIRGIYRPLIKTALKYEIFREVHNAG